MLAIGLRDLAVRAVRRVRDRHVGRVAETQREVRLGRLQRDREGRVVDDLESRDRGRTLDGVADVVSALDRVEEVVVELLVRRVGTVVPGLDERVGRHSGSIGELLAGLDLGGPHGAVRVGLEGLRDVVDDRAVRVVGNEAGEHVVDRVAAADFVGRGRDQGVLRVGAVDRDDRFASGARAVAATTAGGHCKAAGRDQRHTRKAGTPRESHGFLLCLRARANARPVMTITSCDPHDSQNGPCNQSVTKMTEIRAWQSSIALWCQKDQSQRAPHRSARPVGRIEAGISLACSRYRFAAAVRSSLTQSAYRRAATAGALNPCAS